MIRLVQLALPALSFLGRHVHARDRNLVADVRARFSFDSTIYDWILTHFADRTQELVNQGFQPLSLSMYGDPANALFAGVFDKRPGPALRWAFGYTMERFLNESAGTAPTGTIPCS